MQANCNEISKLTWPEIKRRVENNCSIIIPMGALEPVGHFTTLGGINFLTEYISKELASRINALVVPIVSMSYSMPFRKFPGTIGVKNSTLESYLQSMVKEITSWCHNPIYVVNGSYFSQKNLTQMIKRLKKHYPQRVIVNLSWYGDKKINSFVHKKINYSCVGRDEIALLAMLSSITPHSIDRDCLHSYFAKGTQEIDKKVYRQWEKRGNDPEKYGKLFGEPFTSTIDSPVNINEETGREIVENVINNFVNKVTPFENKGNDK